MTAATKTNMLTVVIMDGMSGASPPLPHRVLYDVKGTAQPALRAYHHTAQKLHKTKYKYERKPNKKSNHLDITS